MVARYRTSSSFFCQLAETLPNGYSRILLTRIGENTFNVSAVSDKDWSRMSEWEELAAYRRNLSSMDLQDVLTAINNCPLTTAASFYCDNGQVYIDPLVDYGTDMPWDESYDPVHSELMPMWPLQRALDDLKNAPRTPIEQLVKNKNCLSILKLTQKLARLWRRIDEEEVARMNHMAGEESQDEEDRDNAFEDEEAEGEGDDYNFSDEPEEGEEEDGGQGDQDGGVVNDSGEVSEPELELHPSNEDRASFEDDQEEDKCREWYEGNVRVIRARLARSRMPRKATAVRDKYSRI